MTSDALHSTTPGRASPDIPSDRPLQMDGRFGNDADGYRTNAIFGAGPGGSDEPGGRPSAVEQNDRGRMPVSNGRRDVSIRVHREDRG